MSLQTTEPGYDQAILSPPQGYGGVTIYGPVTPRGQLQTFVSTANLFAHRCGDARVSVERT